MDSLPRPLGNEAEWLCALWFGSARGLSNDSCVYERVREREEKERQTEHLFQGSVYRGHDVQMFSTVGHAATCNSVYAISVTRLLFESFHPRAIPRIALATESRV